MLQQNLGMEQVTLIFPTTDLIADFILDQSVSNAEVISSNHALKTVLYKEQIEIAKRQYKAVILNKEVFTVE